MSFLRNVYTLINYGDFATNNNSAKGDPYMQFLSITEKSEAHSDFVQVRLQGVDTTGDIKLLPYVQSDSSTDNAKTVSTKPSWFWYVIIGVSIAGGLLLIVFAWTIFRRKKSTRGRGMYAKLDDPHYQAGGGAGQRQSQNIDMHSLPNVGYNAGAAYDSDPHAVPPYDPHTAQSYNNPWDSRH